MGQVIVLTELTDEELHKQYLHTCAEFGEAVTDQQSLTAKIQQLQVRIQNIKSESNRRRIAAAETMQRFQNAKEAAERKQAEERAAKAMKTPEPMPQEIVEKKLEERHVAAAH